MTNTSTMIASDEPATAFRAVLSLRRLADQVEAAAVLNARSRGWSWDQIGDALGVSRQSVHAKYRRGRAR
jgi:DNA-directed RNA polymerase specialized sigma24 family protein